MFRNGWFLSLVFVTLVTLFFIPLWLGYVDIKASSLPSDWNIYEDLNTGFRINYPARLPFTEGEMTVRFGSFIVLESGSAVRVCADNCRKKRLKHGLINGVPFEYFDVRYPDAEYLVYLFTTFGGIVRLSIPKTQPAFSVADATYDLNLYSGKQLVEPSFDLLGPFFEEMAGSFRLAPRSKLL